MIEFLIPLILIIGTPVLLGWYFYSRCPQCHNKGMKREPYIGSLIDDYHWVCYTCGYRQKYHGHKEHPMIFKDGKFHMMSRPNFRPASPKREGL